MPLNTLRPYRLHAVHKMQPIAADVACSVVCLSVFCVSVFSGAKRLNRSRCRLGGGWLLWVQLTIGRSHSQPRRVTCPRCGLCLHCAVWWTDFHNARVCRLSFRYVYLRPLFKLQMHILKSDHNFCSHSKTKPENQFLRCLIHRMSIPGYCIPRGIKLQKSFRFPQSLPQKHPRKGS